MEERDRKCKGNDQVGLDRPARIAIDCSPGTLHSQSNFEYPRDFVE